MNSSTSSVMKHWLCAFIGGVILAKLGLLASLPKAEAPLELACLVMAAACGLALAKRGETRVLGLAIIIISGFSWGFVHAAPEAPTSGERVRIKATQGLAFAKGQVLVASPSGIYEAYGPQKLGWTAQTRTIKAQGMFSDRRTFLISAKPPFAVTLPSEGAVERWTRTLRGHLVSSVKDAPSRAWLKSLVIGEKSELSHHLKTAFRTAGVYHLLVVSGLHVSMAALFSTVIIRLPFQLLYAARLLSPGAWRHLAAGLGPVTAAVAFFYALLSGLSAASQRAALVFAVWQFTSVFSGTMPVRLRLLLAATVQTLFFPIGSLGVGNLLSWTAYLLVLSSGLGGSAGFRRELGVIFGLQLKLCMVVGALLAQLSLLGVLVNILAVPVFPLIFAGTIYAALPGLPGGSFALALQEAFVGSIDKFAGIVKWYPWLVWNGPELHPWLRWTLFLVSAIFLLNALRNLSITQIETADDR